MHIPSWTIATAAGGAVVAWVVTQVLDHTKKKVLKKAGHEQPQPLSPNDWDEDTVALIYSADALRKRLEVVEGTRIIVTYNRMKQPGVEFDTGKYSQREVEELLHRARIVPRDGAMALQYRKNDFSLEPVFSNLTSAGSPPYRDIAGTVRLKLRVDSDNAERLMAWHVSDDQEITIADVSKSVKAALQPLVINLVSAMLPAEIGQDLDRAELQKQLNAELENHGIITLVREAPTSSDDAEAYRNSRKMIERQEAEVKARLEQQRIEATQREFEATLEHEGRLNQVKRNKELKDATDPQRYLRDKKDAEQVFNEDLKQEVSGTGRRQILEEMKTWRERRKPFSVQLSVAGSPGAARDMSVRPAGTTIKRRIGDTVELSVTSEIAGYLYLLNLGTSGKVWRLFPNDYRKDNRIPANRSILIPDGDFDFAFTAPPGIDYVLAIVSAIRIDKLEKLPINSDGYVPSDIATREMKVMGRELSGSNDWAEATLAIQVS